MGIGAMRDIADGKARVGAGLEHMLKNAGKPCLADSMIKRVGEDHIIGQERGEIIDIIGAEARKGSNIGSDDLFSVVIVRCAFGSC